MKGNKASAKQAHSKQNSKQNDELQDIVYDLCDSGRKPVPQAYRPQQRRVQINSQEIESDFY